MAGVAELAEGEVPEGLTVGDATFPHDLEQLVSASKDAGTKLLTWLDGHLSASK